jgi:hypothetical protein
MLPPRTLLQPAWSHSQPSHSLATSQIQAAALDPNSLRENAGSSMYTGVPDPRVPVSLAIFDPPRSLSGVRRPCHYDGAGRP